MNTKSMVVGLVIALVLSAGMASALSNSGGEDWQYYREITIKENSGTPLSGYQVLIELNSANFDFSKAKSDGSDIRFTDASGNELNYWIEEWNAGSRSAKIWVKVPSIPSSGETKITMYYRNANAGSVSDGAKVFETFLDKNSLGNWINAGFGAPNEWNIVNGDLHFYSTKDYAAKEYAVNVPSQYVIETVENAMNSYRFIGYDSLTPDTRIFDIYWHTYDNLEKYHWAYAHGAPEKDISSALASPNVYFKIKITIDERSRKVNCFIYDQSSGSLIASFLNKNYAYNNPQRLNYLAVVDGFGGCDADIYTKYIFIRKYSTSEPTVSISVEFPTQKIPSLALTKSASPSTIQEGETTTISIRVENTGTGDAKTVEVTDTIPIGFKIISGSKSESIDVIKPGDYRTCEYTLKATGSGKFTCDPATATYTDADGNSYSTASNSMSLQVGGEVPVGADSDGDGWSDEKEREMGTNPYSVDSDSDGLRDPQDPIQRCPSRRKRRWDSKWCSRLRDC